MNIGQAERLLHDLGNSYEEVAHTLRTHGITGGVCKSNTCPIATYLISQGADPTLNVSARRTFISIADHDGVINPMPVRQFIHAFDGGMFPELEEE